MSTDPAPTTIRRRWPVALPPVAVVVSVVWVLVQAAGASGALTATVEDPGRLGGLLLVALSAGHVGWGHLLVNLALWWVYQPAVERRLGPWCVAVLAAGQAAGVAAHLAAVQLSDAPAGRTLVGGSFLVAAALGAYLAVGPRRRVPVTLAVVVLVFEALLVGEQLAGGRTSHTGHLAAALAGALAALVAARQVRHQA